MPSKTDPRTAPANARLFVVRPASASVPSPAATLSRLKDERRLVDVARLKGSRRGWVVQVPQTAKPERQVWNDLRKALGEDFNVIPALGDERGGYRYPTGYLSLRFESGATPEALRQIARQHHLKFVRREQFTDKQALFKPEKGGQAFLPALLEKIARDKSVDDVWLDAESVYHRG
jgi:hypothetical protein